MEGILRWILRTGSEAKRIEEDQEALLDEIKEVSRLMVCTEAWFQLECDSDLIEACIYQREALHARYRYLLNKAKEQGLSSAPFQKEIAQKGADF